MVTYFRGAAKPMAANKTCQKTLGFQIKKVEKSAVMSQHHMLATWTYFLFETYGSLVSSSLLIFQEAVRSLLKCQQISYCQIIYLVALKSKRDSTYMEIALGVGKQRRSSVFE